MGLGVLATPASVGFAVVLIAAGFFMVIMGSRRRHGHQPAEPGTLRTGAEIAQLAGRTQEGPAASLWAKSDAQWRQWVAQAIGGSPDVQAVALNEAMRALSAGGSSDDAAARALSVASELQQQRAKLEHLEWAIHEISALRDDEVTREALLARFSTRATALRAAEAAAILPAPRPVALAPSIVGPGAPAAAQPDVAVVRPVVEPRTPVAVPASLAPVPARAARPAPTAPSARQLLFRRLGGTVRSELALHWLAFVGVALTFTGSLGFVLFAFNTVDLLLRSVATVSTPVVLFLAAFYLHRRGSVLVAHSIETLAAALTLVAMLADLAMFLDQPARAAAQVAGSLLLMAAYWVAWRRRPASPLRYLVAPMGWAAAWSCGFLVDSQYSAVQTAFVGVALVAGSAIALRFRGHPVATATRAVSVGGVAGVYVLTLLFGLADGSPVALAVGGASAIVSLELLAFGLTDRRLSILQPLLFGSVALVIAPGVSLGLLGAVTAGAYLGLLEWQEWRRPAGWGLALALLGALAGTCCALASPWSMALTGAGMAAWTHVRRVRRLPSLSEKPPRWTRLAFDGLAAVLPVPAVVGLLQVVPLAPGLLGAAATALAMSAVSRAWLPTSRFYRWYLPATAIGLALAADGLLYDQPALQVATIFLAALAVGLAPGWPSLRTWMAAALTAWAAALGLAAAGVAPEVQLISFAAVGSVLAAGATAYRARPAGHFAMVGFGIALGAILTPSAPWAHVVTLAAFAASVASVVVTQERAPTATVELLGRLGDRVRLRSLALALPAIALVVTLPFLVVAAGGVVGAFSGRRALAGVALGVTALLYAVVVRLVQRRRPLAPTLAIGSTALSGLAIAVAAPDSWPLVATVGAAILAVVALGRTHRGHVRPWLAWALGGAEALLLAHVLGLPEADLDYVLFGAGTVGLVGGLALDDILAGRRVQGEGLRREWLTPPVAIGALAVPGALAFTFPLGASTFGWWMLVAAALYLVVSLQLRAGAVTGATYALGVFGVTVLVPWNPLAHPQLLAPEALALVLAGAALERWHPAGVDTWTGWDLPPLVVAHVVALVGLARTFEAGQVATTYAAFGAVAFIVAGWRRHWAWAAAGLALVVVGAAAAGPGWLAAALLGTTGCAVFSASRTAGAVRAALQWAAVVAGTAAWCEFLVWLSTPWTMALALTVLAFGGAAFLTALLSRRLAPDWIIPPFTVASAALWFAAVAVLAGGRPLAPQGLILVVGVALHAAGTCLAAARLRPLLREAGALEGAVGAAILLYELRVPLLIDGSLAAAAGALLFGAALTLARTRTSSAWVRSLELAGAAVSAAAVVLGFAVLPSRGLLVAAFLCAALEAVAVRLAHRLAAVAYTTPALLCAAWLTYASDALTGNANWFTVPLGLAALALVELARYDRRQAKRSPATRMLVLLEYAGCASILGAGIVDTVARSLAFGLLVIVLGLLIGGWGALTRVRRRVEIGAGAIALALAIMIGVPLAQLVPQFRGVVLWIALAGLGVVLLVVATTIEQSRDRVVGTVHRVEKLMVGWE